MTLRRLWKRWDDGMRKLGAATDATALARADEALGDWPSFLFLSPARNQRDDCPNVLAQLATTRAVLSVLASIATGTRPALPPGATEKDGFVELLEADGLKIRLRR